MQEVDQSVIRFVVSWLAQLVGIVALAIGISHVEFTPGTTVITELVAVTLGFPRFPGHIE